MAGTPGWDRWCQREFLHKMQSEGKIEKFKMAGEEAKIRKDNAMNPTKDRIFPDELETHYYLGNFERHESHAHKERKSDSRRAARRELSKKCDQLASELDNEVERTRGIEQEIQRRTASAQGLSTTLGATRPMSSAASLAGSTISKYSDAQ